MIKSFSRFWQNFAVFKGRSRRRDLWFVFLSQLIIGAALGAAGHFFSPFKYVSYVYALVCVVPSLALCVRRLHDTGRAGSHLLLALIPIVGWIIIFVNFLSDSKKEDNAYGSSEKYGVSDAVPEEAEQAQEPAPIDIPPVYASQPHLDFVAAAPVAEENTDKPSPAQPEAVPPVYTPPVQTTYAPKEQSVYTPPVQTTYAPKEQPVHTPPVQTTYAPKEQPVYTPPVQTTYAPKEQPVYTPPVQPQSTEPSQQQSNPYLYGRPMYNTQPRRQSVPQAQPAQPETDTAADDTQKTQRQGYKTNGFPYGN